jgi:hypothetical protein
LSAGRVGLRRMRSDVCDNIPPDLFAQLMKHRHFPHAPKIAPVMACGLPDRGCPRDGQPAILTVHEMIFPAAADPEASCARLLFGPDPAGKRAPGVSRGAAAEWRRPPQV